MQLRSGKIVDKQSISDKEAAEILLSLKNSALINRKIENAPKELQDSCAVCLREIIVESVRKGINIKFESME